MSASRQRTLSSCFHTEMPPRYTPSHAHIAYLHLLSRKQNRDKTVEQDKGKRQPWCESEPDGQPMSGTLVENAGFLAAASFWCSRRLRKRALSLRGLGCINEHQKMRAFSPVNAGQQRVKASWTVHGGRCTVDGVGGSVVLWTQAPRPDARWLCNAASRVWTNTAAMVVRHCKN